MYINNPPIPYCGSIGFKLFNGSIVRVSGKTFPTSNCFAINLQCGPSVSPRDDVALHLSPVFTRPPRIVRNTIVANRWGKEESYGGFPIDAGSPFEFVIKLESNKYKITLNSIPFAEYRHRVLPDRVTHIAIDGDVQVHLIAVEKACSEFETSCVSDRSSVSYPMAPPLPLPPPPSSSYPPTNPFISTGSMYPQLNSSTSSCGEPGFRTQYTTTGQGYTSVYPAPAPPQQPSTSRYREPYSSQPSYPAGYPSTGNANNW